MDNDELRAFLNEHITARWYHKSRRTTLAANGEIETVRIEPNGALFFELVPEGGKGNTTDVTIPVEVCLRWLAEALRRGGLTA